MKTKICSKCKIEMDITNFNFKKNRSGESKTQPYCKYCQTKYKSEYYQKNKQKLIGYANQRKNKFKSDFYTEILLKSKCETCGEQAPECLDFHHINPKNKKHSISKLRAGGSMDLLKKEIKKCKILCSNCHRKITAKTNNWYGYSKEILL